MENDTNPTSPRFITFQRPTNQKLYLIYLIGILVATGQTVATSQASASTSIYKTEISQNPWLTHSPNFPCSGYSPEFIPEYYDTLSKAGITTLGPVYKDAGVFLETMLPKNFSFLFTIDVKKFFIRSDAPTLKDLKNYIKKVVSKNSHNKQIAGWYVLPEEIKAWVPYELELFRITTREIRKHDPYERPVFTYEPSNRRAEYLVQTADHQDIIAKGLYVNYNKKMKSRYWLSNSFAEVVKATELLAKKRQYLLPVAVLEMFEDYPGTTEKQIEKWVEHDTLLALASGAKGIIIYSFAKRDNFSFHNRYLKFYIRTLTNLCGASELGTAFKQGEISKIDFELLNDDEFMGSMPRNNSQLNQQSLQNRQRKLVTTILLSQNKKFWILAINSSRKRVSILFTDTKFSRCRTGQKFDSQLKRTLQENVVNLSALGTHLERLDTECMSALE